MADVERERVTALWREAVAALEDELAWDFGGAGAKRLEAAEAECRRLREREMAAHGEGYDQAIEEVWDAPVCSVCGTDHDADESAMCERGEVVSFREWVDECGRLREQLDAARQAFAPFVTRGSGPNRPARAPSWEHGGQYVVWLNRGEWERARAALGVEGEQEKPK